MQCMGFSSCGLQAPEHAGSVVVAHRLSCPAACGITVPNRDQTCIPRIGRPILSHWTTRESQQVIFLSFGFFICKTGLVMVCE